MGCLASKSRRVNVPPPSVHVVSPQVSVHDIPHDALPVTPRPPSTTTNTPNTTIHSTDSREATASSKAHQLSKAFSSSGLPGGGGSGRRNSRHHTKGVLASVRSHLSLLNTSNRSVNSNRSSRNSFGVSTSGGSMKGYKFDAMLEPDPGSNHTLVDSAFRAKGYRWIISQVESKTHAALDVHKSYMGDDLQHEVKLFHGGDVVDAVRNRNVMTVLDTYAKCLWDTLTMSATTSMWRVQCLEVVDAATCYTQVMVVDGISPGHPLVLNVLLKFVRESVDRHVIVLRNIAEDAKFPLPRQSIAFSVSGWIVLDRALVASGRRLGFEQNPKPATHARSLFRCRATKDSTEPSIPLPPHSEGPTQPHPDDDEDTAAIMSEWLMNAIVQIFHAIESSAIQQLSTIDIKPKR